MNEERKQMHAYKIALALVFVSAMLLGLVTFSRPVRAQGVPDMDTMVVAVKGGLYGVDPITNNEEGQLLIQNVYDTLIRYAVNRTEPDVRKQGKVDQFESSLATEWTISPDGLTYTFKIREGVKFHNGAFLTTEDVEYSFERAMVHNLGGSAYVFYEPLLGIRTADMNWPSDESNPINQAVQRNSTHVWFNLVSPYAPFLGILAGSKASIINKQWAIMEGCWDGNWATWKDYHKPSHSPLNDPEPVAMGTGPYMFDYLTPGVEWSIVKFDDYWQGWPAPSTEGFVSRVIIKNIPDWTTRKEMFLNGSADIVTVPSANISELIVDPGPPETYVEGVRCSKDLPVLIGCAFFFNFDISGDSLYLGPSFDPAHPYVIAEDRIPVNFFSDIDVRKAFAYSINYTHVAEDASYGTYTAIPLSSPVLEGLSYYNPDNPKYDINLTKAEEHFRAAWGGQVWDNGFNFVLPVVSEGEDPTDYRETTAHIIKTSVEALNPKFHIDIQDVTWFTYVNDFYEGRMLGLIYAWVAGYSDPHNFVESFMHSQGPLLPYLSYSNATVDTLIEDGLTTLDPAIRQEIYYVLQLMYYQDVPSAPLFQQVLRHWERDWVQGWYYNPAYPFEEKNYFYHLWKANTPAGSNVEVSIPATGVTVTFDNVTSGGTTEATVSSSGPPEPSGFKLGEPPTYYEINTTATYTDTIDICIVYNETQFAHEENLRLLQWNGTAWHDVTVSLDTLNNVICGQVTSFSIFSIMQSSFTRTSGTVVDEYTGQPIEDIEISILETNASTFTDEQGVYFVDLAPGNYTVEMTVPYGYLTHDAVTKFVEVPPLTVVRVNFTLYQASWADATVPRTIGYWKNWDNHYTPELMATYIEYVKSASGLFSDLTVEDVESYFKISRRSSMEDKVQAQLLASWLNVVSAQLGVDVQVDLASISGWETVIADDDGVLTVDELLRQIDNFYTTDAALARDDWEIVKKILDALNNGKLFVT